jgi:regulator of protease activity HflC (stomatin/prohibitin superfamily)
MEKSFNPLKLIKWAAAVIIAAVLTLSFVGVERIDAGHVGLKVNMVGGDKGVSKTEYVTGWVFYLKPFTKVYEFPTFQQHKDYDQFDVPSKGGTVFNVHPSFNYNLNSGKVAEMFTTFRLPLTQLENGYLQNALMVSLREVTNTFTVDSILNNLSGYDAAVLAKLNEKLHPYFTVTTFTSRLEPDGRLKDVIAAKSQAIQEALQLENEQKKIQVQAENDIIEAKRDSTVDVVKAQAQAKAIQLQQQALQQSPQYVELIKAQKWDGKLPQYQFGGGTGMFLNVGK